MNIRELNDSWNSLHQLGLGGQSEQGIQKMISHGASQIVSEINKRLFRDMAVLAFAVIISAFGVIFFYLKYDPAKHHWIDMSGIISIQILALVLFSLLFVFGWMEYRIVNRNFNPATLKTEIAELLDGLQNSFKLFMVIVLPLLFVIFFVELHYFVAGLGLTKLMIKITGSFFLTAISYLIIKKYHKHSYGEYLENLSTYRNELEGN